MNGNDRLREHLNVLRVMRFSAPMLTPREKDALDSVVAALASPTVAPVSGDAMALLVEIREQDYLSGSMRSRIDELRNQIIEPPALAAPTSVADTFVVVDNCRASKGYLATIHTDERMDIGTLLTKVSTATKTAGG